MRPIVLWRIPLHPHPSGAKTPSQIDGSAWSTRKEIHEKIQRYKGTFDIFLGVERKEETEEQLDKVAKEGWRFAADAAGITDERADNEDQTHTSGGVFVAVNGNL